MTSHHASTKISCIGSNDRRAGLLHTIAAHVRAYVGRQRLLREHDRTRSDILTLPDHLLKDIGLSRHQIKYAAEDRPDFDRKIVTIGTANESKADQRAVSGAYSNSFEMRICKTVMTDFSMAYGAKPTLQQAVVAEGDCN